MKVSWDITLGNILQIATFVVAVVVWFARVEGALEQIREVQKVHAETLKTLTDVANAQAKQLVRLETLLEVQRAINREMGAGIGAGAGGGK